MGMADYFIRDPKGLLVNPKNIVQGKHYRFSILTDRLIRIEYSDKGIFEDAPTQNVIFRNFPEVHYTKDTSETLLQISTQYFTLNYVMEKDFTKNKLTSNTILKINLRDTDKSWYYGRLEARNFKTIGYSLDDYNNKLDLNNGLYSTDGFAILDDSNSYIIKNTMEFAERQNKEIDLYVFMYKKDLGLCLQDYYNLTGYPLLIPRYALGNWWFKNENYNLEEVKKIVEKFQDNQIPLSVFMLGNKEKENIDSLKNINTYLNQNNIKTGITFDPYSVLDKNKIPTSDTVTNYFNNNINPIYSSGINILNLDINDKNNTKNLSIINHYHNISKSGVLKTRPLTLCRNTNISMHRYPIIFAGYTKVNLETLKVLPFYNTYASNKGLSFIAYPIGGYHEGIENKELYLRYIQFGTFSSIFMLSSDGGKFYKRAPWNWDESTKEVVAKYMRLRNQLIPYLYTESYIYYKSGSPLIQPLYYSYPKIYDEPKYRNEYFLGQSLLVYPITKAKNTVIDRVVQDIFIPEGVWYNLFTGKKYMGNKYYTNFFKDIDYPVFCREGSILPLSLDTTTDSPVNMRILLFVGSNGNYKMYEDDGITENYISGSYAITDYNLICEQDACMFTSKQINTAYGIPATRNYELIFKNTKESEVVATVNGSPINFTSEHKDNDMIVKLNNVPTSSDLSVILRAPSISSTTLNLINDDIREILYDIEIETTTKEKVDEIMFSDLPIKKKRIAIRKLSKYKLELKYINMFLDLLEYINTI